MPLRNVLEVSKEVSSAHFDQRVSKLQDRKSWQSKKWETFWVQGYVLYSSARENTRENH